MWFKSESKAKDSQNRKNRVYIIPQNIAEYLYRC